MSQQFPDTDADADADDEGNGEQIQRPGLSAHDLEMIKHFIGKYPPWERSPLWRYDLTQDPYYQPTRAYREACEIVEEAWPSPSS